LLALNKTGGGIRPIAVGLTFRRLASKLAVKLLSDDMTALLAPRQLGFGSSGGIEAAVHAARWYLRHLPPDHFILKLDFRNAFNSIRRDAMLKAVENLADTIYPFVYSAYSSPSMLFWDNHTLSSAEGVQQGDPLGPLLFCFSIHDLSCKLSADFCVMYLDDVTLGGSVDQLGHDLEIIQQAEELGLVLNNAKSEVIGISGSGHERELLSFLPGASFVSPLSAELLGSPIGDISCVEKAIFDKIEALKIIGARLEKFDVHDAIILLRYCFTIPKLMFLLRTAPCFLSSSLPEYDSTLCSIFCSISNISMSTDDAAWFQATLPVRFGGIGLFSAIQLAPSAFLASAAASLVLFQSLLPSPPSSVPHYDEALTEWSSRVSSSPPCGLEACNQRAWRAPLVSFTVDKLFSEASSDSDRARLLAVSSRGASAWLQALPISALGLRMDDPTMRISIGLRLGLSLCQPHNCQHCGACVDSFGVHGLSCKKSEGRHYRHASLNNLFLRALSSAGIPARLEPSGLSRSDGKRPDGATMVPWAYGKPLIWDVTCPDTLAQCYRSLSSVSSGAVAAQAEFKKINKYKSFDNFTPISIETLGAYGPLSLKFVLELGRRIRLYTEEENSVMYLLQRISVTIQRGNAISILGSLPTSCNLYFI
jgi:hypothetical protein